MWESRTLPGFKYEPRFSKEGLGFLFLGLVLIQPKVSVNQSFYRFFFIVGGAIEQAVGTMDSESVNICGHCILECHGYDNHECDELTL